jgi:hypothetical protein
MESRSEPDVLFPVAKLMFVQTGPPPFQGPVYPLGFSHESQNESWGAEH